MEENNNQKIIYVFIDASNLWETQKVKGKFFDFEKLKFYLKKIHNAKDIKIFYYTAYPADGTRDYSLSGKHKFFTYLKKGLVFIVRKKEIKRISIHNEIGDFIEEKGNMDVEISIDMIHFKNHYDEVVLFSGDSDFLALVNYIKNANKKVYIYSSKNNISEELRTGGNGYKDILKIEDDIWGRELKHREQNDK